MIDSLGPAVRADPTDVDPTMISYVATGNGHNGVRSHLLVGLHGTETTTGWVWNESMLKPREIHITLQVFPQ